MDPIGSLLIFLIPLMPWAAIYMIVRHGPIRNRWWRGENALGFAFFVGAITFSVGFFGPMIVAPGANQGPLLGILYTGPLGLLVGAVWGLFRAAGRRSGRSSGTGGARA
jgi:hypothetical protein